MIDFNKIGIDKYMLKHNDKVLLLDISEYEEQNQVVSPYITTVKKAKDVLYFEFEDDDSGLYSDDYRYIIVRVLN